MATFLGWFQIDVDPTSSRLEALVEGSHRQAEMGGRLHKLAAKINRGFGGSGSLFRFG